LPGAPALLDRPFEGGDQRFLLAGEVFRARWEVMPDAGCAQNDVEGAAGKSISSYKAENFEARNETRTRDPFLTMEVLYQLSYPGGSGDFREA
jgi:hypothetical protein